MTRSSRRFWIHSKLKVNLSYIVRPCLELGDGDTKKGKEKEREEGMKVRGAGSLKVSPVKSPLPVLPRPVLSMPHSGV